MESGRSTPVVQESGVSTPAVTTTGAKKARICVYCGASPGTKPEHMEMARSLARVMAANNIGLVYGGGTVGLMGELAKTLVSLSGPESVRGIIPEALVKYERDSTYASTAPLTNISVDALAVVSPNNNTTTTTTTSTSTHSPSPLRNASPAPTAEEGPNGHAPTPSPSPYPASDPTPRLPVPTESIYGLTTVVRDMHTRKALMAKLVMEGGPGSGFIALSGGYGTLEELLETCTWNQLGIHDKAICLLNVNGFFDGLVGWIDKAVSEGFIKEGNKNILAYAETAEDAVRKLREYKVPDTVFKLQWGTQ